MSPAPTTATLFQLTTVSHSRGDFLLRLGLESVDGNAALVRILAQHEVDLPSDLDVRPVADRLQHQTGAVVHVEHHDRQRRDEWRGHRLIHHERMHAAVACERDRLELRPATVDAMGMDGRWRADGAAIDAPAAEQPEHLVGAAHDHRGPGGDALRDPLGYRLA